MDGLKLADLKTDPAAGAAVDIDMGFIILYTYRRTAGTDTRLTESAFICIHLVWSRGLVEWYQGAGTLADYN